MRISQYAYFALRSSVVPAAEMTARLGLEPDEVSVRGSRTADPPRPVSHSWKIVCADGGLTVDQQVGRIMERLRPYRDRIVALSQALAGHGAAVLEVVRYLDDPDGEDEELSPPGVALQKLPGRHRLLGWTLDREVLEFLVATGAYLDVDEYG
ncbi:DUF4279 domain-containing protein [Actinomadura sp. DC4]|uniref:DUF4279 domain-containing protein n=1 Tax=Actinomadura sp. DC4 TaxID=3055069 RepID=UPI0025AF3AF7|nr:DUF4279 domain-containing protein [Actinomadura sp. DC4]MDN3353086.1 DUF4279 domain-containing protein [Actinomadura sp. DC4]